MAKLEDGTPRAAELREHALVALTAVEYTQDEDAERGTDALEMLFKAYSREEVNQGAMLALTVLLSYEAKVLEVPLSERVEFARNLIRDGFVFEPGDLGDEEDGPQ